jgi:competence protein ComGC
MAVKRESRKSETLVHDDRGQSVLEFLLVLPLMMAVILLIIRSNTAIQMSIVDQKYAREQVMFLAGNSPEYPLRAGIVKDLASRGMNQLVVGVSEDKPSDGEGGDGSDTKASTYYIGRRPGGMSEQQDAGDDITRRVTIRIRNTVTLCLPQVAIGTKPSYDFDPSGNGTSQYNYPEDPRAWKFCSSTLEQRT